MKAIAGRGFFLIAVLGCVLTLYGQAAAAGEITCLDEKQIQQAMHEEALRLMVQKVEMEKNGSTSGFDYHIEQAYEKLKKRLPAEPLTTDQLTVFLQQVLQNPNAGGDDREFQTLIEHFVLGMSLEIINTLQYECDQAEALITQVARLEGEIRSIPHADRDALDRALRQSNLSKKTQRIVKAIDRYWKIPAADADHFNAFNVWKKNMTGQSMDSDQRLVFNLGSRYQQKYPFLDQFIGHYRRLAETFRQAVYDLNARLDNSG